MSDARHDLGIRCGYFLPMTGGQADVSRDIYLGIRAERIVEIAPFEHRHQSSAHRLIDARNHAVIPGLVNAHTHLPMTLFRGLQDDVSFHQWLFDTILPVEKQVVDPEFVRVGSELAALECIRFGVTTVSEMYHFAESSAETLDRLGLRALVVQPVVSAPTPETPILGSDYEALLLRLKSRFAGHPRIRIGLGPHAPYTVTDDDWRKVVTLSERHDVPIHTHLGETAQEVADSRAQHGMSPVARLHRLGVLQRRAICAHCVHLDEADTELMRAAGASVVYNPDSNAKLASGVAPIPRYLKAGIPVALGTDGAASNNDLSLFGAMDLGTKLQKLMSGDTTAMGAVDALRAATWGGAQALGILDQIGSLEIGKRADVLLIDLQVPHLRPIHDLRSQLVYAAQGLEVDTVICDGRILLDRRQWVGVDPEAVYARVESQRQRIDKAFGKRDST